MSSLKHGPSLWAAVILWLSVGLAGCAQPGDEAVDLASPGSAQVAAAATSPELDRLENEAKAAEAAAREAAARAEEARKRANEARARAEAEAKEARARAEAEAKQRAEEEARARAEQEAREAAVRAEEARKRAEEEERKRAEEEARTCAPILPSTKCSDPLAPGDERSCTLANRAYTIRAGRTMSTCRRVALVIDLHGDGGTSRQQLGKETYCYGNLCWIGIGSGWAAESDKSGFVVVAPQAPRGTWARGDAGYLRQLVDEVKRMVNVDPERVYISGISGGAELALEAGCAYPNVFRGISPNAGGYTCPGVGRPVSMISFSSPADQNHGRNVAAAQQLAGLNQCKRGPFAWKTIDARTTEPLCKSAPSDPRARVVPCASVTSTKLAPTTCRMWDECSGGTRVVLCDVAAANDHGRANAALDAHIVYENATLLNTPSLAWRFFTELK